jgi:hypothetical protein
MRKISYITLIFLLGCKVNPSFNYDEPTYVDYASPFDLPNENRTHTADIETFVSEFRDHAKKLNYPLENYEIFTKFADLKSKSTHILGQCQIYTDDRLVLVDESFWQSASADDKRTLIYHELGHCYLNRSHRTLYYQGPFAHYDQGLVPHWDESTHLYWPISLMHKSLVKADMVNAEFAFYIRELFDEHFQNSYPDNTVFNCTGDEHEF